MVRLKAEIAEYAGVSPRCFNSTMVRLKACTISIPNPHKYYKEKMKNEGFDRQPPVMQKS
jgi:hypothetical protein